MRFTYRRFPVHCSVTYNAGPLQGHGTVWNLSCTGWRLSGEWFAGREEPGTYAPDSPHPK